MSSRYTCFDVADYFLFIANGSGSFLSNLKLQKLVYYAQAWHLAIKGTPIFDEDFQAWPHGPVIYSLWKKYSKFSFKPIESKVAKPNFDSAVLSVIEEVAQVYFRRDALELEMMTHREAPWVDARRGLGPTERSNNVISKASMLKYFKARVASKS